MARVNITPPMGAPLDAYYYNRAATGIHDALPAKAIVLSEQGVRLVSITYDLSAMPDGIPAQARQIIARQNEIPSSRVTIGATHSHVAPVALSGFSGYQLKGRCRESNQDDAARLPNPIGQAATSRK